MTGWAQFAVGGEEGPFYFFFFLLPLFPELAGVLMEKNLMPPYIIVKLLAFLIHFSCYFLFLVFLYFFFDFIKYLWSLLMESAKKSHFTSSNILKCLLGK